MNTICVDVEGKNGNKKQRVFLQTWGQVHEFMKCLRKEGVRWTDSVRKGGCTLFTQDDHTILATATQVNSRY